MRKPGILIRVLPENGLLEMLRITSPHYRWLVLGVLLPVLAFFGRDLSNTATVSASSKRTILCRVRERARPAGCHFPGWHYFVCRQHAGWDAGGLRSWPWHAHVQGAGCPVGLEPVTVAARNNMEVWVANLLSDSVSVVSQKGIPHVIATLLVGDEPRDIVFAGQPVRAFITTALPSWPAAHLILPS